MVDEAAAKLKMEITSKPEALDVVDRQVLQLEMERLSLGKAAVRDKAAASRLSVLDIELAGLKQESKKITGQWESERSEMMKVKDIKKEIERVNLEVQQAGEWPRGPSASKFEFELILSHPLSNAHSLYRYRARLRP